MVISPRARSGPILRGAATFGCVPVSDDASTRAHLNDLCAALGQALGIEIKSHRAPSASALASAFGAGRIQLAWASPALAVTDPALAEAVPLVRSVREGVSRYHAVVFTRIDGPVQSLAELAEKSVGWVDLTSASGYLFPRLTLARAGISPDRLFKREQVFGSHGAVAHAVRTGQVEVGGTFAVFEGGDSSRPMKRAGFAPEGQGMDDFRVLAISPPIPSDVVLASPALVDSLRSDPVEALEGISASENAASALWHVLGADSFVRVSRSELDELRDQLLEARLLATG
jgi:phosphonate transport system substrate-binding protein